MYFSFFKTEFYMFTPNIEIKAENKSTSVLLLIQYFQYERKNIKKKSRWLFMELYASCNNCNTLLIAQFEVMSQNTFTEENQEIKWTKSLPYIKINLRKVSETFYKFPNKNNPFYFYFSLISLSKLALCLVGSEVEIIQHEYFCFLASILSP